MGHLGTRAPLVAGAAFLVVILAAPQARAVYCPFDYYASRDGCDCECDFGWDPDCEVPGQSVYNCNAGEVCLYPGVCGSVCAGWTCDPSYYASRDGCDCGCGCWDPDCALASQDVYGCADNHACREPGICVPLCAGWSCPPSYYGDGVCHCECGCWDPDCGDLEAPIVGCNPGEGCAQPGYCAFVCPGWSCAADGYNARDGCHCDCGCWDPDCDQPSAEVIGCGDNEGCQGPTGECVPLGPVLCPEWGCDEAWFGANDGCHCGCGCWDPDCDDPWQSVIGCEAGQDCVPPGACTGTGPGYCQGWTCPPAYYDDGANCDCACGCWDPDCEDPALPIFNCPAAYECVRPGLCLQPCVAQCAGRVCGADGCGGSCGDCPTGSACTPAGQCQAECVPDCAGRVCGPDPVCGSSCGACKPQEICTDAGRCEDECAPDCEGRVCGPDGCGGQCGRCDEGSTCDEQGQCVTDCVPDCAGRVCGPDGCEGSCGDCAEGEQCDEAGQCVTVCVPDCAGRLCGPDGCAGSCGDCAEGEQCDEAGQCVAVCVPDCAGRLCGPDGCEGSCGDCAAGFSCGVEGRCVLDEAVCTPDCAGRVCGPDGCEGTCGQCPFGEVCTYGGACVPYDVVTGDEEGAGGCAAGGGAPGALAPFLLFAMVLAFRALGGPRRPGCARRAGRSRPA